MATKNNKTTNKQDKLHKLQAELKQIRLDIKAGKNKNTNAHKSIKKQVAQLLTK